ncbi:hypothetical protein HFP51_02750 [Parasphingopyxis sp. CP4]|uniref:hypothetical protein n=1 Tax=Parasphingopyxis sp. CP4 TaxID=2724527 RepID=UPI0015A35C96|nr:hypothetical protein [Parasphingopyxis sp. CP4]QLC21198.1 hypothetical protein HFP51_02750 [Parasphingopyxis sp. CP4]
MNKVLRRNPPGSFWVISVLLLVWNGMGVAAYLSQAFSSYESLAASYPAEEVAIMQSMPAWATAGFAVAVFAGFLGVIALLARKGIARWLFILSLIGVIAQHSWTFGMSGLVDIVGPERMIMPLIVVVICIFQIWYAGTGIKRGWIR